MKDWFLLESVERRVRSVPEARRNAVRRYFDAGMRRALVAEDLTDDAAVVSGLVVYREAIGLLAAALSAALDPNSAADEAPIGAPWETIEGLARAGHLPPPPPSFEEARRILSPSGPLAYDAMSPETLRAEHTTVEGTVRWLSRQLDPRSIRQIRMTRYLRLAALGAVVLYLLVRLVSAIFAPTDIALHKKVTISGRLPVSVAPPDGSGLVNGEIERDYGIHTTVGNAWVLIDLGAVYAIKDVVTHNRADGWYDESLPLVLELSEDGTHFSPLETRTTHFSASAPWVAEAHGRRARYVRISSIHYVTLTEVEVHEAK